MDLFGLAGRVGCRFPLECFLCTLYPVLLVEAHSCHPDQGKQG